MEKRRLTDEQKQKIKEMYVQGIATRNIAKELGVTSTTVSYTAKGLGVSMRKPRRKVCKKCGATAASVEARFCHICGAELLTNKERILKKLEKVIANLSLLPEAAQEGVWRDVQSIREYINASEDK